MNNIKIYTDSTSDLNDNLKAKHEINILPLYVTFDQETYKDLIEMNPEKLYEKIEKTGKLPKTSAASVGDYIELFEKELNEGNDVLLICISSHFSSTYQNALIAKDSLNTDRVEIIDSLNLSTSLGLLALKADKLRKEGDNIHQIKEKLEAIRDNVKCHFAIESLEYLHKGGRCSGATRLFGTLLKIKPVIVVNEGKMEVDVKTKGKQKALSYMLEDIISKKDLVDTDYIMVTHTYADDEAIYLKQELEKEFPNVNIEINNAGSVISSHCGKGTIGILYILK